MVAGCWCSPEISRRGEKRKITAMERDFFNETSHQMLSGAINSFTWYIRYFSFLLFLLLLVCFLHFSWLVLLFFFGELFNVFIARVFFSASIGNFSTQNFAFYWNLFFRRFQERFTSKMRVARFECNLFFSLLINIGL